MHITNRLLNIVLIITLSIAACVVIFIYVDMRSLWSAMISANPFFLALAIACLLFYQFLRTLRLQVILRNHDSRVKLFAGISLQGIVNNILPAGMGELVLIWLVRRLLGCTVGSSLTAVMVARLFDIAVLSLSALCILLLAATKFPAFIFWSALILLSASLIIGCFLIYISVRRFHWPHGTNYPIWLRKFRWNINRVVHSLRALHNIHLTLSTLLLTLLIWSTFFFTYIFIVYALNLDLAIIEILIIYVLSFPIQLIPIKTIANIGVFEGVWVIILAVLGRNEQEALTIAVTAHFGILMVLILSALIISLAVGATLSFKKSSST